ncbi:MAG: hypothetical protein EXX96DRAFT_388928 [Benjaminiella poitrasii]|nr:MAG: hypothetical protein EXX96DRAFT_388928 [Benjaminiella poitrasii]
MHICAVFFFFNVCIYVDCPETCILLFLFLKIKIDKRDFFFLSFCLKISQQSKVHSKDYMSHDNYELPSIYSRKTEINDNFGDSEDEEEEIILNGSSSDARIRIIPETSVLPSRQQVYRNAHLEDNRLAWLMLGASFFILFMTLIPVVCDLPYITPWFTGDALWRFFDPLITLPLNLFIITRADSVKNGNPNYCM